MVPTRLNERPYRPHASRLFRGSAVAVVVAAVGCQGVTDSVLSYSWRVKQETAVLAGLNSELRTLGPKVLGQTVSEVGAQHLMTASQPPEAPWLQLDLGKNKKVDSVTLVPAVLSFDATDSGAYAFPRRFRLDASDDADFATFEPLYETGDKDFEAIDGLPLIVSTPGLKARFLRLTVTRLAKVSDRWTFALAEVIVLSGDLNVALSASVTMRGTSQLRPVWHSDYLVDGRTPLGPPIVASTSEQGLSPYDGIFNGADSPDAPNWMTVDLGEPSRIDEVRMLPVHARQGADFPGYACPEQFRVELSIDKDFSDPAVVYDTGGKDFPNPGNNPITIVVERGGAGGSLSRYVRVVCIEPSTGHSRKFGFSEIQVYSGNENIALGKPVSMPRPLDGRPPGLLVDGEASYGKILELSAWIDRWKLRRELLIKVRKQEALLQAARLAASDRLKWVTGTLAGVGVVATGAAALGRSRRRRQKQRAFRQRLAQDLHDEIGSNLAAIARLGEVAAMESSSDSQRSDWGSVQELAIECTESMRETLWLLGSHRASSDSLLDRMRLIASRMLAGIDVHWSLPSGDPLAGVDEQVRRELTLAFKEVVANIAKHANASRVLIEVKRVGTNTRVVLDDNGVGFPLGPTDSAEPGERVGLRSLDQRIARTGGTVRIESSRGEGARVTIEIPNKRFKSN